VERVLGYPPESMVGRAAPEMVHPDDLQAVSDAFFEDIERPGSERRMEIRLLHADGSWRHVDVHSRTFRDETGAVGAVVSTRDITELREVEAERSLLFTAERTAREVAEAAERRAAFLARVSEVLDASFHYHHTLAELARLLVPALADYCLIDEVEPDGGTRRVALAHIDPEKEKLLLRNDRNPPDADPRSRPVVRVVRTGIPLLVPEVTPSGLRTLARTPHRRAILEKLALRSYMMIPLIARDRTLGALTLVSSESGRRYGPADLELAGEVARRAALSVDNARLYGQSQQATRAREEVLAVVSHDLVNPLSTILLTATSMMQTAADRLTDAERDQLEWIARSSEQMNHLIQDLLEVARAESGHLSLDRRSIAADELTQEAYSNFLLPAQQHRVRLECEGSGEGVHVLADRKRVLQVFANLLGNAIKFTPPEGRVLIHSRVNPGAVTFTITDSGAGIEPVDLAHIFDRFWQAKRSSSGGAGLGLAIARGIVEAHGGRIWADSAVGEGSAFHFTLPTID
jgi:PAS domain S-box-containing protein